MTVVTLPEKIVAVEDAIKHFAMHGGPTHPRTLVLEAVLADLRAWETRTYYEWYCAGKKEMRERAAQVADKAFEEYRGIIAEEIAEAIRALPVE